MVMELDIEENIPEEDEYVVIDLNGRFTITTTWMSSKSVLRRWVKRVHKIYRRKLRNRTLVVGLCADRSVNYANGSWFYRSLKASEQPYELLQICVGRHCLLCHMTKENPKALKDLLHNGRTTVVGVGIDKLLGKLAEENGWRVVPTRTADLGELAAADKGDQSLRWKGLASLAGAVLGDDMMLKKPAGIMWTHHPYTSFPPLTRDLLKFASVEPFLASLMGERLLFPNQQTHQL